MCMYISIYIIYYIDSMLALERYTCCGLINWYTVYKQIMPNILHTSNIDIKSCAYGGFFPIGILDCRRVGGMNPL